MSYICDYCGKTAKIVSTKKGKYLCDSCCTFEDKEEQDMIWIKYKELLDKKEFPNTETEIIMSNVIRELELKITNLIGIIKNIFDEIECLAVNEDTESQLVLEKDSFDELHRKHNR